MFRRAGTIALSLLALSSTAVAAQFHPPPSFIPMRAPALAYSCTSLPDGEPGQRNTGFCAGYIRAVLENDPRLGQCTPLMADVLNEIIARHRAEPLFDENVFARDFVVEVALDLCRRRPS